MSLYFHRQQDNSFSQAPVSHKKVLQGHLIELNLPIIFLINGQTNYKLWRIAHKLRLDYFNLFSIPSVIVPPLFQTG